MIALIGFIILLFILLSVRQYAGKYYFKYKIRNTRVEHLLFGLIPIGSVKFDNIEDIRMYDPEKDKDPYPYDWENRAYGNEVIIIQKRGLSKNIILTPDNPSEFIKEIKKHITL